ncbi:hypothetical protein LZ318_39035 [Saccharopolyspora indica]|uniref:allene oxide cyclase barrel-like domain-containing protein n=1 Tax=Saccharopolyspora indica TaxID=1229659 RepID=UPI0022EAA2D7|nr:hypothetical protein [Saccharopolyspora indica]MDA3642643.1 hypothetical protein [Saccharopolyspora indica]
MSAKKVFAVGGGLAVIGLLALAPGSVPAPPAAASPAAAQVIELDVGNDQFVLTDVGEHGLSLGDEYVFSDVLYRNGQRVGYDGGSCQVTHVDGERITTNCTLSLQLPDGQLTAQAVWVRGTDGPMAVTGGTGAYRNARGELHVTDVQTPNEKYRIVITL